MPGSPAGDDGRSAPGFTLIELVVVMVLLGIAAAYVAPHMVSFFRGRVLESEARRMLALTRYGQQRAVAEGVPMLLWVDARQNAYGLTAQWSSGGADDRAVVYSADSSLSLEADLPDGPPTSEDQDERFGVPGNLPAIRFTPDGFYDDASVARIVIRQDGQAALALAPDANRLEYEIEPAAP
jgi:type II secretion system protein H